MRVLYERCCGLDIHKKFVVACLLRTTAEGSVDKEIRTFSTMTNELLALCDWLGAEQCTHVVMESTASFWRPIYNLLEGHVELLVVKAAHVNAAHVKAVPGRKTDVKDAEWLAELLRQGVVRQGVVRQGVVRGSFIPSPSQRQLRDLTR
jgi:transposase